MGYYGGGYLASVQANRGGGHWVSFSTPQQYPPQLTADPDISDQISSVPGGWQYKDLVHGTIESYASNGVLLNVAYASGATLNYSYSTSSTSTTLAPGSGYLIGLSDTFGRNTQFMYGSTGTLQQVVNPLGQSVVVSTDASLNVNGITHEDGTVHQFLYERADLPWALTGVVAEDGKRLVTYSYDSQGLATQTQMAQGVDAYSVTYGTGPIFTCDESFDPTKNVVWINCSVIPPTPPVITTPQGTSSTVTVASVQGTPRLAGQTQSAGAGCAASSNSVAYDANGNRAWVEDFNGHRSCYANDVSRNLETSRVEGLASGTDCTAPLTASSSLPAGSRKISTQWHPVWRKEIQLAEPGRLTTSVYNGQPDPFNGGAIASCAPSGATLPDGSPIVVLCKQVEQATTDSDGSQGLAAPLDPSVKPRIRSWTYNQFGQVLTAKGPRTDVDDTTTYTYYASTTINVSGGVNFGVTQGDLQSITTPKNAAGVAQVTQFTEYNAAGQLTRMVDSNGVATTYTYDARQRLTSSTVAAGMAQARTTSYSYWPTGLLKTVTFAATASSNAAGATGNPVARSVSYGYDDAHRLTSVTRGSGEQLLYTLDNAGNVTREELIDATGTVDQVLKRDFDALGRLWHHIETINGLDQSTQLGYDAQGNLTSTLRPAVASYGETSGPQELRQYNALNQLTRIEDAVNGSGNPTLLSPDARDLLTQVQTPNGATTGYTVDGFGQTTLEASPDAGNTSNSFDEAGNLKTRSDARGVTQAWTYDALNRPTVKTVRKSGSTDTSEDQSWVWDASPAGAPLVCSNGVGRLCKQSDLSGSTYFAYDVFGNLVQRTVVEGGVTTTQSFSYDGEDRLASVVGAGGRAIALSRDSEGRVSQASVIVAGAALAVVKSSTYRADGQVSATQLGNNVSLTRQFDSSGAISAEADTGVSGTTTTPTTDLQDAPTAPQWLMILLGAWLAWQVARSRNPTGSRRAGNQLHSSAWSTPVAVLILLAAQLAAAPCWADETVQRDERGNVQSRTIDGQASYFQYDQLDRLTSEIGTIDQQLTLDPNGNRLRDGQASYTVQPNGNRLITRSGYSWLYDAAGNLLQDQTELNGRFVTRTFSYWMSGMLKTVSINGQLVATYYHNAQNQRSRKVLANPPAGTPAVTLYRYDSQGMLSEEIAGSGSQTGQTLVTYVWRDTIPVAVIYAPGTPSNTTAQERIVYLHTDELGTPRRASDAGARIVWSWNSDAFGSTAPNEDPGSVGLNTTINLRFAGQYFDAESGLYYNGNRYYDPRTGRYTQSDPIGLNGGMSTYAYVEGNPISYGDPTGLKCNASGCWLAPDEKAFADAGNYMGYYGAACAGGDSYACAAKDVAGNVGLAANFTNWRLRRSLRDNGNSESQCDAKMENIRKDLAQAHAAALSGGSSDKPIVLTADQISQFHHNVFTRNGAGSVFGGDIPGSNLIFNWCSLPSCRP
ncbi:MAG: RHS domain-containing protein [Burkholderiales bacterium]|nr:RHS domain-containing protein [Burkholderiales bacterium]